jgi:hypothetical protein
MLNATAQARDAGRHANALTSILRRQRHCMLLGLYKREVTRDGFGVEHGAYSRAVTTGHVEFHDEELFVLRVLVIT